MARPEFMAKVEGRLEAKHFSVPVFGKVYTRMQELHRENSAFHLTALTRDCTQEETATLVGIFAKFVGGDETALEDYLSIILQEQWKIKDIDSETALQEAMAMFRKKKGTGE